VVLQQLEVAPEGAWALAVLVLRPLLEVEEAVVGGQEGGGAEEEGALELLHLVVVVVLVVARTTRVLGVFAEAGKHSMRGGPQVEAGMTSSAKSSLVNTPSLTATSRAGA